MHLFTRRVYAFLISLFITGVCYCQPTITEVYFPQYMQGAGTFDPADDRKVPFVCRIRISGLNPNKTYRYYNRFVTDPSDGGTGDGNFIIVKQSGDFTRSTSASLASAGSYGEFTTDGTGSYTGWFANEANELLNVFYPGTIIYFRLLLNNGAGGTSEQHFLTAPGSITVINFGDTDIDGTGLYSTPATNGVAKNFVMLYDNSAGTGRPVTGTFIESDGTENSVANGYAPFYAGNVDGTNKAWGTIIPNNLADGIKKIVQYSLLDGSEVGNKTSSDGSWAKQGGGTVSTIRTTGGLNTLIVLDGSVVTLGAVVKSDQSITFDALPVKTYGNGPFPASATASSGLTVSYSSSNPAVATVAGNMIQIVGAGTTDITATQSGNDEFNTAPPVVQTLTVNKATLTVTADNKLKLEGDPIPALTVSYSGFVNGDDDGDLTTRPVVTTTATVASPAGTYPITVSGAAASNYNFLYVAGTLTVTAVKHSQTITFDVLPVKTYGHADFDAGASASSGLVITYTSSDPSVAVILNGKIHIVAAGTATITASQPGNSAYEPAADVTRQLTVDKAPLTIKADNKSRLIGQANPPLTITYNGFVNGENNTNLSAQPVITTIATITSPVGDYPITVSGAASNNYSITYVNGVLTVNPLATQTISFPALPVKKYGDADFALNATASSGLLVTCTSSNTGVARIVNGNMVDVIGTGVTTITASQPGNAAFAPAPDMARELTVQKANLSIKANDQAKYAGQQNPGLTITYSGFVNGDDSSDLSTLPVITTIATKDAVAGQYLISVEGATSPNYTIAHRNGILTVLPAFGDTQNDANVFMSSPGQMQVNIYAVSAGKTAIQVFDLQGTRLFNINVGLVKGHNIFRLPVGNLAPGIYSVRVSGDFVIKRKIIVR